MKVKLGFDQEKRKGGQPKVNSNRCLFQTDVSFCAVQRWPEYATQNIFHWLPHAARCTGTVIDYLG